MIEILPIRLLRDEDALIFGSLNVSLAKLQRGNLPISSGVVVTPPNLHLRTILEHYDFGSKEIFQQSLTLVKKELASIPIPANLQDELKGHKEFFINNKFIDSLKNVWLVLLETWIEEIRNRLWKDGFKFDITENLEPQIISFVKKIKAFGTVFDEGEEITIVVTRGQLEPSHRKNLGDITREANKKLFIPHTYEWILEEEIKLVRILPYTSVVNQTVNKTPEVKIKTSGVVVTQNKSTVKVFSDLSNGFVVEQDVDGIYIASEKIFDLNKAVDSFEELVFKIVEVAVTFPDVPVLVKLADQSEGLPAGRQGMGSVRGTLKLLHQKSLLDPLLEAIDFARHKKSLTNVHLVIPFVRSPKELMDIKRELSIKKLMRKTSLQQWLEIAVPENILNLEQYLVTGIDGVVLNLDELIGYLNGFDGSQEDLMFYKNEVGGLLKFLEDGIKIINKSKVPFIAVGSLIFNPKVLEFSVEKGVYGVVVERYEAHSVHDLLHQTEKRMILRKSV